MSLVSYAYDGQIRKFVLQFIRMLSNFQVEFGQDANGDRTLQSVPISTQRKLKIMECIAMNRISGTTRKR